MLKRVALAAAAGLAGQPGAGPVTARLLGFDLYQLDVASLADGSEVHVIVGRDGRLHGPASAWLAFLRDVGRSPNTVRAYGARVAAFLGWIAGTADWQRISINHLAMWRRTVASAPYQRTSDELALRSPQTVNLWMIAVRSFYEWADAAGLLASDIAARMTHMRYFPAGTAAGGEHGSTRRVLVDALKPSRAPVAPDPEWISSAEARTRLENLELNHRDRLLIDLMYYTGIRAGEALCLFRGDMHLAGGTVELACRLVNPHFHVRCDNDVENGARAKGKERVLFVGPAIVENYIDYILEREALLGRLDLSRHVFVNLYARGEAAGRAMRYGGVRRLIERCSRMIAFRLSGPHVLRHTFATRLVRGIDCDPQPLDVVQELLGHRSISSTRTYTHDLEPAKRQALASIDPRSVSLDL